VPYVEVDNLSVATDRALQNGAQMIAADVQGPAGVATFVRDPGGSAIAIWKRSEAK